MGTNGSSGTPAADVPTPSVASLRCHRSEGVASVHRFEIPRLPAVPATAWAMGYASLAVLGWCVALGLPLTFDARPPYVLSLLYL